MDTFPAPGSRCYDDLQGVAVRCPDFTLPSPTDYGS